MMAICRAPIGGIRLGYCTTFPEKNNWIFRRSGGLSLWLRQNFFAAFFLLQIDNLSLSEYTNGIPKHCVEVLHYGVQMGCDNPASVRR